jgi:cyclopropane fatty-acyl-phospholipid synthase-like methyltransferase
LLIYPKFFNPFKLIMNPFNPLGLDVFEIVLYLVENLPYMMTALALLWALIATSKEKNEKLLAPPSTSGKIWKGMKKWWLFTFPLTAITSLILSVYASSYYDAYARGYQVFSVPSLRSKVEDYIASGKDDLNDILESGKYPPTFGFYEMRYLVRDLLKDTLFHLNSHNEENIAEGYNKGNDWFTATLGESMMYTSGLYPTGEETLLEAQNYKIDYVANALQLQPGHNVLDIGCGWTYMANRLTEKYGANVTGLTLSEEQYKWGIKLNENNNAKILLQDAMKVKERNDLPPDGFDRITSLEMAEHVGIRRYQEFLHTVHSLLKDDGVFYFQVAGLRRSWRFEDLVWGLFMGEWVFPGADASCPLGWVSTQLERAGFEIQRVHNFGTHYSRTLAQWLENWRAKKDYIEGKYGETAFRRWEVFLAWSVRVARQGSSTVFMFTLTKAGDEPRRIESQAHLIPKDVVQV